MEPVIRRSESIAKLATALAAAQAEMGAPQRTSENPHFGSSYADLAEVRKASVPALNKHGIAVMQAPTLLDATMAAVETLMVHGESGEWISFTSAAPMAPRYAKAKDGEPSGKMLPPDAQSVGSATTYLRRYALAALTGVAQEDDDGNAAARRGKRKSEAAAFSLDDKVGVGKHKDQTWREVLAEAPDYVQWACDKMDKLSTDAKLVLRDALLARSKPASWVELNELVDSARTLRLLDEKQNSRCVDALDAEAPEDVRQKTIEWLRTKLEAGKVAGNGNGHAPAPAPQGDLIGAGR